MTTAPSRRHLAARDVVRVGAIVLLLAWGSAHSGRAPARVLGEKVVRPSCALTAAPGDATSSASVTLPAGVYREDASNAPLSFTVRDGKLGPALAPPLHITAPVEETPQLLAFNLGVRPFSPGEVAVTATFTNLSDCPVGLSVGRAVAQAPNGRKYPVSLSFGSADTTMLQPGSKATGRGVVPLSGDGDYWLDGQVYAELGGAR